MIQKFKKEEELEFDQSFFHYDKPEDLIIEKSNTSIKDLDARIAYQYPKNNLRPNPIQKTIDLGMPQKTGQERRARRKQPDLSKSETVHEPIIKKGPVAKKAPVPKKEPSSRSRGPFHPTEIPSPVYGFNRPKKQASVIEHELTYFLEEDSQVVVRDWPVKTDRVKPATEKLESTRVSQPTFQPSSMADGEETAAKILKEDSQVVLRDSLVKTDRVKPATEKLESTRVSQPTLPPSSMADGEEAAAKTLEEDSQVVLRDSLVKTDRVKPAAEKLESTRVSHTTFQPSSMAEGEEAAAKKEPVDVANAVVPDTVEEQALAKIMGHPIPESSITDQPQELTSAATVIQPEEDTYPMEPSASSEDNGEGAGPTVQGQEIDAEPEQTTQRPRRSHLPFNVLMLKQDRQSWSSRQEKRAQTEKQNPPAVVHQAAPVPESNSQSEIIQELESFSDPGLFQFPENNLLSPPVIESDDTEWLEKQQEILNQTLHDFNVGASVVNVTQGPSVTRFEVQPEPGVKVNKITNLSDDIKLSLAARDIRIEAPIPGKHTIGIEVPNKKARPVFISEIIETHVFRTSPSPLTAVLGLDIAGSPIVTDLKKMPHGLIAGATGSGKSVCINSILVSLLYKATPDDLKLLLIDPKMVELAPYNRLPHLVSPVITDVKAATAALKWAVEEMERRYELFAHTGVRDINRFNELAMKHKQYADKLPYIVIVIDELADLMMMSPADVEEAICRIAQKARACGIHLIVATQRPSVDVITGLIKANIPTRIAFSVSSQVDSRTIIDISGAEKLLGRGDMLFLENGSSKPVRLQGTFVSDEEIDRITAHVRSQREPEYLFEQEELLKKTQVTSEEDELFYDACEFIIDHGGASTSSLQRRFKIGYNRAARLMDMLEDSGYISGANGSKPREVLITETDLESIQDSL